MKNKNALEADYIEKGRGETIVTIPGMEGSKEFWSFQQEELSDSYRVVSVGLMRRKPRLSSSISDYASDVIRIMDCLEIDKAIIIGESMGGMITQEIALNCPSRVRGIVLCNTMDRPRRGGFGFNMFTLATFANNLAFLPFLSDEKRRKILRWVGKHRGLVMDPSPGNEELIDYMLTYGMDCGISCYADRMIACGRARYTEDLHRIDVPTLVLRGTEDRLIGPDTAVELAGRIPCAEMVLIDGGGHGCQITVPELTTRKIRDWLNRKGL